MNALLWPAEAVTAARLFAAGKTSERDDLKGVQLRIHSDQVIAVLATDRYTAAVIGDVDTQPEHDLFVLDMDCESLTLALIAHGNIRVSLVDEYTLAIGEFRIPCTRASIYTVPALKKQLDKPDGMHVSRVLSRVNPDYLAKLKPFKNKLCARLKPAVRKSIPAVISNPGNLQQATRVYFEHNDIDDATVLIMPLAN